MTIEQLDLEGNVRIVGLTDRQQDALLFVERMGGCTLDELGAFMCERRGKHQADVRCKWCLDNGSAIANELHKKGLLERRSGGWYSTRPLESGPVFQAAAAAGSDSSGSAAEPARSPTAAPAPNSAAQARSTDPETSRIAAASVTDLNAKQQAVLKLFRRHGGMHDEDLLNAYDVTPDVVKQSDSGLRTRRRELVEYGLLRDSGRKTKTTTGRATIIWEIADAGQRALHALAGPTDEIPF